MNFATLLIPVLGLIFAVGACNAPVDGSAAYADFIAWKAVPANVGLGWDHAIAKYEAKLKAGGMSAELAAKTVSVIAARDEASLYDPVYAGVPKFDTAPNRLLVEALKLRKPGKALDVGMGQGRNAIFMAQQGWEVTGFDVAAIGLEHTRRQAQKAGVSIQTVLASDEEFDFGSSRWDMIAILYPIEKRSVFRVRQALKPGGFVVIECGHKEAGNMPFEYDSGELLKIFEGFRILKYEEPVAMHDWARKELRLVRLIAQKPQ